MSPVSTLVLTITLRTAAPGDDWVQLADEDKLLTETPAPRALQPLLALEYLLGAPQSGMALYPARFSRKISQTMQKLLGQTGNTEIMQRNTLLKIREIFRLLIERPRKSVGVCPCGRLLACNAGGHKGTPLHRMRENQHEP